MSFISLEFIIFALIVFPLYFLIPHRWRWLYLLIASYIFYAWWEVSYLALIIFSTVVDYGVARAIDQTPPALVTRRRVYLTVSVVVNLGVLFTFKYFNFFSQSLAEALASFGMPIDMAVLNVLLPVGISFYTFQSMAYTIDVYQGRLPAHKHLGIFATYVAFFPQLVAGPIERATNMLPQFERHITWDYDRIVSGLRLALWGVFKKVVIADRLAIYVNTVYNDVGNYTGLTLILATLFFTFQIYCDFSGYSDIAIGIARVMGFDLMENFRQPYLATSLGDFWRRWHISLSTWFRDYVYIPLGGNRLGLYRQLVNLFIVFAVSGLWHGANWTFVMWGVYHGLIIVVETFLRAKNVRLLPRNMVGYILSLLYAFLLAYIGWIFFRANSIQDASYILSQLTNFSTRFVDLTQPFNDGLLPQRIEFFLSFGLIGMLMIVDGLAERVGLLAAFARLSWLPRWSFYYVLIICIYVSLFYNTTTQSFIYFQF